MLIVRQIGRLVRVTRAAANIQLKLVPAAACQTGSQSLAICTRQQNSSDYITIVTWIHHFSIEIKLISRSKFCSYSKGEMKRRKVLKKQSQTNKFKVVVSN